MGREFRVDRVRYMSIRVGKLRRCISVSGGITTENKLEGSGIQFAGRRQTPCHCESGLGLRGHFDESCPHFGRPSRPTRVSHPQSTVLSYKSHFHVSLWGERQSVRENRHVFAGRSSSCAVCKSRRVCHVETDQQVLVARTVSGNPLPASKHDEGFSLYCRTESRDFVAGRYPENRVSINHEATRCLPCSATESCTLVPS